MTTRAEAITAAADCFARGLRTAYGQDGTTVEEAARLAYTPTGPSIPELEARIRALRGIDTALSNTA